MGVIVTFLIAGIILVVWLAWLAMLWGVALWAPKAKGATDAGRSARTAD